LKTIAFVGNPNVGKTALINAIAGSDLDVGNWPGVTVEKKEITFKYENEDIHLIDLPGAYTLYPYTLEEKVTKNYLIKEKVNTIINVVNSTNLRRNLYLTLELIDMQKSMVLSLNMFDDFSKRGYEIDTEKLKNLLGVDVVPTIASRKLGVKDILKYAVKSNKIPKILGYQEHIEKEIEFLEKKLDIELNFSKRFFALKLLEEDEEILKLANDELKEFAKEAKERIETHTQTKFNTLLAHSRYEIIDSILKEVLKAPLVDKVLLTDKLDSVILNKYLGIPIFLFLMYLMFKFTFDGSAPFITWMSDFFGNFLAPHLKESLITLPNWLNSLLIDGVLSGVGLVLSFLPLLTFLYFFMALLEESGYMARVSFLLDKLAQSLGVKGNSFIALIMGFGCNVPAVYATRALTSQEEKEL